MWRAVSLRLPMRAAVLWFICAFGTLISGTSILQKIYLEPEFTVFASLLRNDRIASLAFHRQSLTVFVPTNEAFGKFTGIPTHELILYHLSFNATDLKKTSVEKTTAFPSCHQDNPPLWVTYNAEGVHVNDAKVLLDYSVYQRRNYGKSLQVLHVIDKVLDPMVQHLDAPPDALDFLKHSDLWHIQNYDTSKFLKLVERNNLNSLFAKNGSHTFFVPTEGVSNMDGLAIEGHVISDRVLFTRAARKGVEYTTYFGNGAFRTTATFGSDSIKLSIQCQGDAQSPVEILKLLAENIPLKNGVLHLVEKPVVTVTRKLHPFPFQSAFYKISSDPFLNTSYGIGERSGLNQKLLENGGRKFTYFVPRDKAWTISKLCPWVDERRILRRHLVVLDVSLTLDDIKNETRLISESGPLDISAEKAADGRWYISWKNSRFPVYRENYRCSDGIIHILDAPFLEPGEICNRQTNYYDYRHSLKKLIGKAASMIKKRFWFNQVSH